MRLRNEFIAWYNNDFKRDPLYITMLGTTEASPWHREVNVGIHTDMVVNEYISWVDKKWSSTSNIHLGAIACAFHDTGKPSARVQKYSDKRGHYNSFGGHEIISARLWEDFAMRNFDTFVKRFGLSIRDIYTIGFIIEHHMPYEQPAEKIRDIAITCDQLSVRSVFVDHLTSDTHGRIADDHVEKIGKVDAWVENFLSIDNYLPISTGEKWVYMPVAPSGSGKSTFYSNWKNGKDAVDFDYYSWDALRLEWYDPDYKIAYQKSVDDSGFNNKVMKVFYDMLKTGNNIYIDNTNLSRKRRAPYIAAARKAGYQTKAFLFPNSIQTLLDRQSTRGDKVVPESAVRQHYMSLQLPLYGEFDQIQSIMP